ncbi:hypothetical protein CANCADRAFT_98711 [Tortispora caseinolytica NRRL Y-17796]|uniref:Uncharacterized protein n=1 Tax=Tortispora caseinolytica NRRL Y-17796 TaxID=767744 RepID=A0A1E4TDY2_9ASCO|nr:hypothetical protein CANCADRAFT_98711 [Tortispora caseinolytica NRRL Y-17796]
MRIEKFYKYWEKWAVVIGQIDINTCTRKLPMKPYHFPCMKFYSEYLPRLSRVLIVCEEPIKRVCRNVATVSDGSEYMLACETSYCGDCNDKTLKLTSNTDVEQHFRDVPDIWPASELQGKPLSCVHCNTVLASGAKHCFDLPSEYWEELLDLWHCHEPISETTSLRYAVSSNIHCQEHTLYTASTYLLLNAKDCLVKVS